MKGKNTEDETFKELWYPWLNKLEPTLLPSSGQIIRVIIKNEMDLIRGDIWKIKKNKM